MHANILFLDELFHKIWLSIKKKTYDFVLDLGSGEKQLTRDPSADLLDDYRNDAEIPGNIN